MKKLILLTILLFCYMFSFADNTDTDLRKKISQMIMIGFTGTELEKDNPVCDDIINERISGVILYQKNVLTSVMDIKYTPKDIISPNQLKKLIKQIKKIAPNKLFIAMDEEGGQASLLPVQLGFDVTTFSHRELGERNETGFTHKEAEKIAATLNDLGINVNFAPCIDLDINKEAPVCRKGRSFSDDPQTVFKHAQAFIQAHNKYKILTVAKHFPGRGSEMDDFHRGFIDISSTWTKTELEPYILLNKKWLLNAVKVAHVYNKNLDKKYSACLSEKIITDLLRKTVGFKGIVFSEDMQTRAVTNNYNLDDAIITAINAGVDVLIFGNNIRYDKNIAKKFNDIVFNAVKDGKISQDRIDDAYNKIVTTKSVLN